MAPTSKGKTPDTLVDIKDPSKNNEKGEKNISYVLRVFKMTCYQNVFNSRRQVEG